MSFASWLRNLKSDWYRSSSGRNSPSARRPARSGPAKRFRPRLEVLEDRTVPTTFNVTTTLDGGAGSLRAAISAANANPGPDTILLPAGLYNMAIGGHDDDTNAIGDFDISDSVTIQGVSADTTVVDARTLDRVFDVFGTPASPISVTFQGLTIQGGFRNDGPGGGILMADADVTVLDCIVAGNSGTYGGGINNKIGTLTLTNSILSSNSASVNGGGIVSGTQLSDSTLTLSNSTLSGNTAGFDGGGIFSRGALTLSNSTLSGNTAGQNGGGIDTFIWNGLSVATISNSTLSGNTAQDGGGMSLVGPRTTISNSTFYGNTATRDGGGIQGGGDANNCPELNSTIVAGNKASRFGPDLVGFFPLAFSLIQRMDFTFTFTETVPGSNFFGVNPLLGPLAYNGGPTLTHALLAGSLAINAGDNALVPPGLNTDQRGPGFPRIYGGIVDIGAYERQRPNDIALTQVLLAENSAGGTFVGTLAATDLHPEHTFSYTLVNSAGGRFNLAAAAGANNAMLVVAPGAVLDFETSPNLTIRVRATDSFGVSFEKDLVINLTNVNEAPRATVPGTQSVTKNLPFIFAGPKRISVADPDAGAGIIRVTLSVTLGKLNLFSSVGLTSVTGNGTARIVLRGSVAAINAALIKLKFTPKKDVTGRGVLTIFTEDLGNTGLGVPLTDTHKVRLNIA